MLAVALLWLVAAAGRLLMAFAEGALRMGSATVMALGDAAWPGWQSGQEPGHSGSPVRDRPQSDGTDMP